VNPEWIGFSVQRKPENGAMYDESKDARCSGSGLSNLVQPVLHSDCTF